MPCLGQTPVPAHDVDIRDLLEIHPFQAQQCFRPEDKSELAAVVAQASSSKQAIRALGSGWSLSNSFTCTDTVIDTSLLDRHLAEPLAAHTGQLGENRFRYSRDSPSLLPAIRDGLPVLPQSRRLIHVEAGIKLGKLARRQESVVDQSDRPGLLDDLETCSLALPTMGAGGGQSLGGLLGTGTHGGDFDVALLADWVHAVHLIVPGGQELWVCRSDIAVDWTLLRSVPGWCPDTRVIASDDCLQAATVAVGRFGVVYAVVLEVVDQYGLFEVSERGPDWLGATGLRAQLGTTRSTNEGILRTDLTPLSDTNGWLHQTLLAPLDAALVRLDEEVKGLPVNDGRDLVLSDYDEAWYATLRSWIVQRRAAFESVVNAPAVSGPVLDGGPHPLRHINIVLSLLNPGLDCWIERRWQVPTPRADVTPPEPRDKLVKDLIAAKTGMAAIPILQEEFSPHGAVYLVSILEQTFADQILTPFRAAVIPQVCEESATSVDALFAALVAILHEQFSHAREDIRSAVRGKISDVVGNGLGVKHDIRFGEQPWCPRVRIGPATQLLDTHDYGLDGLQHGHSTEFHFDASSDFYLNFIDEVLARARANAPVLGVIGIRFVPKSTSLISMDSELFNVAVEVQVGRGLSEDQDFHRQFFDEILHLGIELAGRPHWGQEFVPSPEQSQLLYGARLEVWRSMLATVHGTDTSFSTPFSKQCGLEPTSTPATLAVQTDADLVTFLTVALSVT